MQTDAKFLVGRNVLNSRERAILHVCANVTQQKSNTRSNVNFLIVMMHTENIFFFFAIFWFASKKTFLFDLVKFDLFVFVARGD